VIYRYGGIVTAVLVTAAVCHVLACLHYLVGESEAHDSLGDQCG
jgi:hypothetical protein